MSDSAKPCTRDLMMFMVFPKESPEHVHVEQKSHALKASMSLTSWEVIVPFVVRITGKPSSAVAIVNGSTFIAIHFVANFPARDTFAERVNHAGKIETQGER